MLDVSLDHLIFEDKVSRGTWSSPTRLDYLASDLWDSPAPTFSAPGARPRLSHMGSADLNSGCICVVNTLLTEPFSQTP